MTIDWNDPQDVEALREQLDREDAERAARLARPEALAESAAWYASVGLHIFPLVPGEKRPLTKHGLHDASNDPEQVAAWWRATPQANVAFRTGLTFDVIDVDGPAGYASLADLREAGAVPDVLGRVVTSRGGAHLYVPVTGRGNKAGVYPGIDYRGAGGYVVAPPSLSSATGRRWVWTAPVDFPALTKAVA